MQVEDVGEREEEGLRADVKGVVLVAILVPVVSYILDGRDLDVAHSNQGAEQNGTKHFD